MRNLGLLLVFVVACGGSPTQPTSSKEPSPPAPSEPSARPDGQLDRESDVLWSRNTSATALPLQGALGFCSNQGEGWRLPTRAELSSLFSGPDWELLERELKDDFQTTMPDPGRLWSGDDVSPDRVGQKWAVNLYDGTFQNLHEREAYARCVHGEKLVERSLEFPSDVPYNASQGAAASKVTWTLYCQYDPFCKGLVPALNEAVTKRSLRVVWKQWVVSRRLKWDSLAVCAATRQGQWAKMHELVVAANERQPTREHAEANASKLGLDRERFVADLEGACPAALAANSQNARRLNLEGTPSLILAPGQVMSPFLGLGKLKPEFEAAIEAIPSR